MIGEGGCVVGVPGVPKVKNKLSLSLAILLNQRSSFLSLASFPYRLNTTSRTFIKPFFTCINFQVPAITDLRNPSLKARHWDSIQTILNYHFTDDVPLTLGLLNELNAFDHMEEIQEVSSQASSEASLEGILKKVIIAYQLICCH